MGILYDGIMYNNTKDKVLIQTMNCQSIILSERSQIQKIPFKGILRKRKLVIESRLVTVMGQMVEYGWRHMGTFGDDVIVLCLDHSVSYRIAYIFQNSLNYPLKISEF